MAYFIDKTDYLEHYGRIGMKWGQHIFGKKASAHRAFNKAAKTAEEYDRQTETLRKATRLKEKILNSKQEDTKKDASLELLKLGVSNDEEYEALLDDFIRSTKVLDKQFNKLSKTEYGRILAEDLLEEFKENVGPDDNRYKQISESALARNEKARAKEEKRKARG